MNIISKLIKLIVVALTVAAGFTVGFLVLEKSYSINEPPRAGDVIVVLGCAAQEDGSPSPLLRSRVERGVELWKAGFAPYLLFTGSAVANHAVEAEVMGRLAQELGVPESAEILETNARSTAENARFTKQILAANGWHSILLVTSPFHTRRARRLFAENGVEITTVSAAYPPGYPFNERVRRLLRELKE